MSERGRGARRFAVTSSITLLVGSISSFAMGDMTKAQCADANVKAQDLRRDGRLSEARGGHRGTLGLVGPAMLEYFESRPFGTKVDPYANGVPGDFPSFCVVGPRAANGSAP